MISSLKAMHVSILRILAYMFFNRHNEGLHHLQSFLNVYHSWRAGACFSPPPPSNYLRKTNTFVVWYIKWAASGFFPLNCLRVLCLVSQLTEHSGHVLEVVFSYQKTTIHLLGLYITERTKSLKFMSVLRHQELAANCEFFERYMLNYYMCT